MKVFSECFNVITYDLLNQDYIPLAAYTVILSLTFHKDRLQHIDNHIFRRFMY